MIRAIEIDLQDTVEEARVASDSRRAREYYGGMDELLMSERMILRPPKEGDAEALAFDKDSFEAVVCPFGLLHLERPEQAVSEAFRVLKPGGRYGFSVWCSLDKFQYIALVLRAIQAHANTDVGLPPAPDFSVANGRSMAWT